MTSLRRRSRLLLLGVAAVGLLALGILAATSLRQVSQAAVTINEACAPAPCAAPDGFEVDVSRLASTGDMVTMHVRFKNQTKPSAFEAVSYRHTSPADFQLRTADGHVVGPMFNSQCPDWGELDISRSARAGPEPLCFSAGYLGVKKTKLIWSPDLGFFFDSVQIPLA